jgi:hypothetical protein
MSKRRDDIIKDLQARLASDDEAIIVKFMGRFGGIDISMEKPFFIWGGNPRARERALKAALKIVEAEKRFLQAITDEMVNDGSTAGRADEDQKAELQRRAMARRSGGQ